MKRKKKLSSQTCELISTHTLHPQKSEAAIGLRAKLNEGRFEWNSPPCIPHTPAQPLSLSWLPTWPKGGIVALLTGQSPEYSLATFYCQAGFCVWVGVLAGSLFFKGTHPRFHFLSFSSCLGPRKVLVFGANCASASLCGGQTQDKPGHSSLFLNR